MQCRETTTFLRSRRFEIATAKEEEAQKAEKKSESTIFPSQLKKA